LPTQNELNVLGIIPARGGSKGIARKNIRALAGNPLIAYAIDNAIESTRLTSFVTSTDDDEIAEIARSHGSPVIMRPSHLAADDTPMTPVLESVIEAVEQDAAGVEGWPTTARVDAIVLLQPTAPLRTSADVDAVVDLLLTTDADTVVSVYQVDDHHPSRMYTLRDDRLVPFVDNEPKNMLRQSLPAVYHRNGAVYACRRSMIVEKQQLVGNDLIPYIMPADRSANVDSEVDLEYLEFIMQNRAK